MLLSLFSPFVFLLFLFPLSHIEPFFKVRHGTMRWTTSRACCGPKWSARSARKSPRASLGITWNITAVGYFYRSSHPRGFATRSAEIRMTQKALCRLNRWNGGVLCRVMCCVLCVVCMFVSSFLFTLPAARIVKTPLLDHFPRWSGTFRMAGSGLFVPCMWSV